MTERDIIAVADAFEPKYRATMRDIGNIAARAYVSGGKARVISSLKASSSALATLMNKNHLVAVTRGAKSVKIKKRAKAKTPGYMSVDDPEDDVVAQIAAQFLKNNGNRADDVTDTTMTLARQTVAAGVEAGMSPDKIAALLKDTLGGAVADYRARMIARTETAAAFNYANLETVKEMEDSVGALNKVWVAATDERVRDSHAEADGQSVGLNEDFTVGSSSMQHPGDPNGDAEEVINCRCTMIYEPVEN